MALRFKWDDDSHQIMLYIVEGDWNWRDYHACARASSFSLNYGGENPVHSLIDFSASTRLDFPAGALGHMRTFGRKIHPRFSGRSAVVALPEKIALLLDLDENRQMETIDGVLTVADSLEEARQILLGS